ncbi:hypothetical protein GCM10027186_17520 [Micromonospora schwarzwaldensis]
MQLSVKPRECMTIATLVLFGLTYRASVGMGVRIPLRSPRFGGRSSWSFPDFGRLSVKGAQCHSTPESDSRLSDRFEGRSPRHQT